jgi:hypothetical protein
MSKGLITFQSTRREGRDGSIAEQGRSVDRVSIHTPVKGATST